MPEMRLYSPNICIERVDNQTAYFSKVPCALQVNLSEPLAPDGYGTATVDGVLLSKGEFVTAKGEYLLMLPFGEAARDYGRSYSVRLEGFRAASGEPFPPVTFSVTAEPKRMLDPAYAEHDEAALNAAREGMVLLRNERHLLPLAAESTLNCFGIGQHTFRIAIGGASNINPRWRPTFYEAVAEHSRFRVNEELSEFYRTLTVAAPDEGMLQRAREKSDTALIFITRHSCEIMDNRPIAGQYELSDAETQILDAVTRVFEKTVVILNIGHPIALRWLEKYHIQSVVYTGLGGMLGAYALVELLDGRVNPSGHLPITLAWDYADNPANRNFVTLPEGVPNLGEHEKGVRLCYAEDIYLGYRYFDTFAKPVAFPFGHGLSYTTFAIVPGEAVPENGRVSVPVTVTNTGDAAGKEVVQLYLSEPEGRLEKPAHVLCAFEKTPLLHPGEAVTLTLTAAERDFASFDEAKSAYVLEAGRYRCFVGDSLGALQSAGAFTLSEEKVLRTVAHLGCPTEPFQRLSRETPMVLPQSALTAEGEQIAVHAKRVPYAPAPLEQQGTEPILWPQVRENPALLESFAAQLTTDELCALNVNRGPEWGLGESGVAGTTAALERYGLPSVRVSDANAGWNIVKPNIGFPCSSTIAATFNREIAYQVGAVIAEEGQELNIAINLGPAMNLQRAPLNGRNAEYFSEDPYLGGIMAGYHGKGLEEHGVGCCYKHLFCNNSELCRKASHSVVSERALRELYFRTFELAFSVQKPSTVMTAYNALNGISPAESAELQQELLRDEWGFEGFIMTDWDSCDTIDAVEIVKAGTSWISSGGPVWVKRLQEAAAERRISRAVLEHNAVWLLGTLLRLGH